MTTGYWSANLFCIMTRHLTCWLGNNLHRTADHPNKSLVAMADHALDDGIIITHAILINFIKFSVLFPCSLNGSPIKATIRMKFLEIAQKVDYSNV